jgi:hypothetical protein
MSYDPEKSGVEHIKRTISDESNGAHIAEFTLDEQQKIIRKFDL